MRRLFYPFVVLFLYGCAADLPSSEETYVGVSLIELLANKEKWEGRKIDVAGYSGRINVFALFVSSEHYENIDEFSAVAIRLPSDREVQVRTSCPDSWLRVKGVFGRSDIEDLWEITEIVFVVGLEDSNPSTECAAMSPFSGR